jgi:hypothetical protein
MNLNKCSIFQNINLEEDFKKDKVTKYTQDTNKEKELKIFRAGNDTVVK